jgi:hypothetical protein
MPKIQKVVDVKNGKEYPRYFVNLPKWIVEKQNWNENTVVSCSIVQDGVILQEAKLPGKPKQKD